MAEQRSHPPFNSSAGVPAHFTGDPRRLKRCYHRVISGLEKDPSCRFVTLTSSPQSRNFIQQDLRRLFGRLRRRGILTEYIRVVEYTKSGLEHVHLIYRGRFLPQPELSRLWAEIHQSPIVDIRSVRASRHHLRGAAAELAKYMAKEGCRRYSWSWGWVYKGFVATWKAAKTFYRQFAYFYPGQCSFLNFLSMWHFHLKSRSPPSHFLNFLEKQAIMARHNFYFNPLPEKS
ncbi:hypothetical protein ES705_43600 [subsurface metagenome]